MKNNLCLSIILLTISLSGIAQTIDEAFYVYRNDGHFNAFFRDEVLSIDYSYEDLEGNRYDEIVTQIINTTDSVYKIPLAVIDSISFIKPNTRYKDNVVKIDTLLPYVESIDGLCINLSSTLPSKLFPKIGDVLLYEGYDDICPYGFGGRVTQINGSQVICDSVCIEDVYEEIISYGGFMTIDDASARGLRHAPKKGNLEVSSSIDIRGTIGTTGNSGFFFSHTTQGKLSMALRFVLMYSIGKPTFFEMSFSPELSAKLMVEGKGTFTHDLLENIAFEKNGVILNSPFRWNLKCGPVLKGKCEASVKIETDAKLGFKAGLLYENNKCNGYASNTMKSFSTKFSGHLDGSVFGGVKFEVSLFSFFKIISSSIAITGGAEIVENLKQDFEDINNYEDLQNSHLDLNAEITGKAKGSLNFNKRSKLSIDVNVLSLKTQINTWKLTPTFQTPDVTVNSPTSATVSVKPSGKLFDEISVGLGVWKDDNILVGKHFCSTPYKQTANWVDKFETTFYDLEPDTRYTVLPVIIISGHEIKAKPITSFYTKKEMLCPDDNHPHAIDFNLPSGTKWACCNVGANTPEGFGGYYAFGENEEKSYYDWDSYKFYKSDKVLELSEDSTSIAGTSCDAATVNWGTPWKIPTNEQWKELIYYTSYKHVTLNGINGIILKRHENSIFLPAAGYRSYDKLSGDKSRGSYWSSSINLNSKYVRTLYEFNTANVQGVHTGNIEFGYSIRSVY